MKSNEPQLVPKFRVPPPIAKAMLEREGVDADKLQDMLTRSVRITHPDGNRRYHDYLFVVEGHSVWAVTKLVLMAEPIAAVEKPKPILKPTVAPAPPKPKPLGVLLTQGGPPCENCHATGLIKVYDDCENCDGGPPGCEQCDDGMIARSITCPECKGNKFKSRKAS